MSKPIIYHVPYELLTAKEIEGEGYKKFIVPVYLDLYNNGNNDRECRSTLFWLLTEGCGFESPSGTYGQEIYKQLKEAVSFLQQKNHIGDIVDCKTGEVIDIMTAKPRDILCFDLKNFCTGPMTNPVLISHDDYTKIKNIDYSERGTMFWKTLVMYMYVSSCLGYNPTAKTCKQSYWMFTGEKVWEKLGKGFTRNTVYTLMEILKEYELIDYATVKTPRCIGKATILTMGENQDEIAERMEQAIDLAKEQYLAYCVNRSA